METESADLETSESSELKQIEKLSVDLEELYKSLELLQRENIIFSSFIERKKKTKKLDLSPENLDFTAELLIEQKYEITMEEEEYLKKTIEEGKQKAEDMLTNLRAVLEETEISMKELKKEAAEFMREVLQNGEANSRVDISKLVSFREAKIREKRETISKLRTKKAAMEAKLVKIDSVLRKKEINSDDLKFIDFHQLQIENKKHQRDLDEKNTRLVALKLSTGNIVEKLAHFRAELKLKSEVINRYQQYFEEKQKDIEEYKEEESKILAKITTLSKKNDQLEVHKNKIDDDKHLKMNISTLIEDKERERELIYNIKNFKRKIAIQEVKYQQAVKFFKQRPELCAGEVDLEDSITPVRQKVELHGEK